MLPHHFEYMREAAGKSDQWEEYDKVFRMRLANFPDEFKWNVKDQDAWNDAVLSNLSPRTVVIPNMQVKRSKVDFAKTSSVSAFQSKSVGFDPYLKGLCRKFNVDSCSFGNDCKFRHICGICFPQKELKHSGKFCPFRGKTNK